MVSIFNFALKVLQSFSFSDSLLFHREQEKALSPTQFSASSSKTYLFLAICQTLQSLTVSYSEPTISQQLLLPLSVVGTIIQPVFQESSLILLSFSYPFKSCRFCLLSRSPNLPTSLFQHFQYTSLGLLNYFTSSELYFCF